MNYGLEVVVIPVSDVDKAKDFYQALGWRLDASYTGGPGYRVIQLTPGGKLVLPHDREWGGSLAPVACLGVTLAVTLGCALVSDEAQMKARVLPRSADGRQRTGRDCRARAWSNPVLVAQTE
jgi:catechol 2,3-dioxygenase-like lactoylglutathione lyase family enzyme